MVSHICLLGAAIVSRLLVFIQLLIKLKDLGTLRVNMPRGAGLTLMPLPVAKQSFTMVLTQRQSRAHH